MQPKKSNAPEPTIISANRDDDPSFYETVKSLKPRTNKKMKMISGTPLPKTRTSVKNSKWRSNVLIPFFHYC